jgi:hypothetical protein
MIICSFTNLFFVLINEGEQDGCWVIQQVCGRKKCTEKSDGER